jgi:hypothetical protein
MVEISVAREDAVALPIRRVRLFRYWAVSIIYITAFAVTVAALAACGYSAYLRGTEPPWKLFFALFGTGASSGSFGGYLMAIDRREFALVREQEAMELARIDQEQALDLLREEARQRPEDEHLRTRLIDLLADRAAGKSNLK